MAYAFISSPVRGLKDDRESLHQLGLPDGREVYVDEIDHPRVVGGPAFATLEDLFIQIRRSEVFVVLLATPRHGGPLPFGAEKAHVSYWEAELFYAALIAKPMRVFVTDDFRPEPELAGLLKLLQNVLPRESWFGPFPRRFLVDRVRQSFERPTHEFGLESVSRRVVRAVVDGLYRLRGAEARGGAAEQEAVQFFNGWSPDLTVKMNEPLLRTMFEELRQQTGEEGRLTRL